ncbi:MAG: signal peptidase II [Ilumatobacteraceae bacterium]
MTDDAAAEIDSTPPRESTEVDHEPAHRLRSASPLLTTSIVAAVVLADQLAKRWALSALGDGRPRHVIWTLQWNLTRNSGMAFSQAQGIGPYIGIVALIVIVWLVWTSRALTSRVTVIAAGLIAGGAIGNLADRIFRGQRVLHGAVVDFIDFQWFPIFNIADMAIDVGGAIFVLWTMLGHRKARQP